MNNQKENNNIGLAYIGTSVFNIGRGNYTSFESTSFSAGRIVRNSSGTYAVQYHITNHLGSVRAVLNQNMAILEQNDYYPFGLRHPNSALKTSANRYRYNGKEEIAADATSDYGARQYSAEFCQWLQVDPLAEKYYSWSPYNFCVGNPIGNVDLDGLAWRPTFTANGLGDQIINGYEWVEPEESYDDNGNLLEGLYEQAIFFSDNGTFDEKGGKNIGSSTATVYLADGTTTTFDACTKPAKAAKFATVPEGLYQAEVGSHKGYPALKMRDVGAVYQTIELGTLNPAYKWRTYAEGIDIHKAGKNNYTGMCKDGVHGVSEGCLLIDRDDWSRFIGIFDNPSQGRNKVGVGVSRSLAAPINANRQLPFLKCYSTFFNR